MTKQEFIKIVATNHSSKKWLNCTVEVDGIKVGIKAYGKWVQRMEGNFKPYWSGCECKTVGAFKLDIETGINYILK